MSTPTWIGPDDELIEQPNSPKYQFGEKCVAVRTYRGPFDLCVASALARGTIGTDDMAGFQVASSEVTKEPRGIGQLVITWEAYSSSSGQSLPPDQYGVEPFEINPDLKKHPRYESLTDAEIQEVDDVFNKASTEELDGLSAELLAKLLRGQTSYYLVGFRYTWTKAFWSISGTVDGGGYVEAPGGPLSGIFPTMAWLRQADHVQFTGQYFLVTKSWVGAPTGHWDEDLYT